MHKGITDAIELFEDFELFFCGNADSVIDHLEVDAAVAVVKMDAEVFLCR